MSAQRCETGVVQFLGDHPGVHIRGDDAFAFAHHLESMLKAAPSTNHLEDTLNHTEGAKDIAIDAVICRQLLKLLRDSEMGVVLSGSYPVQRLVDFKQCLPSSEPP
jgi:hypothetical protein